MSVRDLNKVIIVSSGLTGCVYFTIDFDDYINSSGAKDYLYYKIKDLIDDEEGLILKVGYKN